MKFQDYRYERPNMEEIAKKYDSITTALNNAESVDEQITAVLEHEKIMREWASMESLCYIRHTINTEDEFYSAEHDAFSEMSPLFEEKCQAFYKAVLASKFQPQLKERFGELVFVNLDIAARSFDPKLIPLLQEENALTSEYQKLSASAQIEFDGKICNLSQLSAYKQNPDRALRKAAYEAEGAFFDAHREQYDAIYDKLVKNRTKQAQMLGFENFIPLGYLRMGRNCYTPEDVSTFRKQIVEDLVPVVGELKKEQADRIGVDSFKFYDDVFCYPDGNAVPHGTPEELLEAGRRMYTEMSDTTASFIEFMLDNDLIDPLAKKGKANGGYCTYIPAYESPFIFSNFNGTSGDVDVLTHEAGHALAAYVAKDVELYEMANPGLESCEVHSMSMEFFAQPWYELFFKEDAAKYEESHLDDALIFIPYGCMVDEFQHIVYANPDFTPEQRNQAWLELEEKYRPYIDFDQLPFYGRGAGWQRQSHIYMSPFYYIDYCLAQTIALEFWKASVIDREDAWDRYFTLLSKGGTATFVELVKAAGLISPFESGCIKSIADFVKEQRAK